MNRSSSTPKTGRIRRHYDRFRLCWFETLEVRQVLSASAASSILEALAANLSFDPMFIPSAPQQTAGATGMTPAQIRQAYGFNNTSFNGKKADGTGITIAIVDAGNSPTIVQDLHAFDLAFGLPDPPSFKIVNQNGSSNPAFLPPDDPFISVETALDVEWAHAVAPGANILLVESDDILGAVNYARHVPNVAVVSISYSIGRRQFVPGTNSLTEFIGQTSGDFVFTTPTGHQGISFTVSAGDAGGPTQWPSSSPNVLSVGGTTLSLTKTNNYQSEVVWNEGFNNAGGGGLSGVVFTDGNFQLQISNNAPLGLERAPSYQSALGFTTRATPDVSFNADPFTGYSVYDSFAFGAATPWEVIGGTSAAAPIWAGLIAIADQGRKLLGKSSLGNVQSVIYKLPASDFHDITVGNNDAFGFGLGITGNAAKPGYDLASGRGTPIANLVIRDLVAFNGSTSFTLPSSAFASINVIPTTIFFASNISGATLSSSMPTLQNVSQTLYSPSDDSADPHATAIQNVNAISPQNEDPPRKTSLSLAFESNDDEPIWNSDHHVVLDSNAVAGMYAELDTFFEKV